ncbi:MAG: S8 family serine peptidase [Dehalococcoidales bacterium]|nr:S8 family serine peptidase [Dehalococcoidales bacterium]
MRNKVLKLVFPVLTALLITALSPSSADKVGAVAGEGFSGTTSEQSSAAPALNDEFSDKQWALAKIQAFEAWQSAAADSDVLIAVLDTGIDETQEDLAGRVVASVNFTESPTTDDIYGHGTHIAGIIAATANNGTGIAGLSNSSLLNVKVANDRGLCKASDVAEGIIWAVDNGAEVINLSLAITGSTEALEQAVDYAWENGAILVAAAGNYGSSTPVYPAGYDNCLAVTATNVDDKLAILANHGQWVNIAAPGADIYSTLPDNAYGFKTGTSMATAYVSGLAALLFPLASDSDGDGLVNDEVRSAIEASGDPTEITDIAQGRINAARAVALIKQ